MKTALIMITILGCDDKVSQCEYYATPPERFVSIELCDAASENVLERYGNIGFPTAVAVCQQPPPEIASDPAVAPPSNPAANAQPDSANTSVPTASAEAPEVTEKHRTLAARAVDRIRNVLPGTSDIKMIFETPIHVVSDSYSWVAKKISD
ncbi:hypothetical protein ACSV9I_03605 [Rhizobium sp. G187]|uniref:hypothetical protein n=1 Tax=Rhizobium sp. G187 TaxID=3451352 RepID=UPI003EE530F1